MTIDQHTVLYGVVGNPIRHSLSPALHNAAFSAAGLNAVYLAFETEHIVKWLAGMKALGMKGASVTIPFKTAVLPYLDEVDTLASRIGAVNTIVRDKGRLKGYNTDALGAAKALEEKTTLRGLTCFLIGAGGAARAIGLMLKEKGVEITVVNRSKKRGQGLARSLGCSYMPLKGAWEGNAGLLVQTTPVGMYPHIDDCPVPEDFLKSGMVVMDTIYNPFETKLLQLAKACGCSVIKGIDMFVHQGAEQFRLWTGVNPPMRVMREAAEKALMRQHEEN